MSSSRSCCHYSPEGRKRFLLLHVAVRGLEGLICAQKAHLGILLHFWIPNKNHHTPPLCLILSKVFVFFFGGGVFVFKIAVGSSFKDLFLESSSRGVELRREQRKGKESQADSSMSRTVNGIWSQNPEIMTWAETKSHMLSHPGIPVGSYLKIKYATDEILWFLRFSWKLHGKGKRR